MTRETLRAASLMVLGDLVTRIHRESTPMARDSARWTDAGTKEDVVDAAYNHIRHEGELISGQSLGGALAELGRVQ